MNPAFKASDTAPAYDIRKIKLRGARLLLDKVRAPGFSQERKTSSGLFIPAQTERLRATYGLLARVLAIGPGIDPNEIKPGDTVYIDEFGGRPLWWGSVVQPYWIAGDHEIMCVLRPETAEDMAAIESGGAVDVYARPFTTPSDDAPTPTTFGSGKFTRPRPKRG